jgi:hypothetical protein
MERSPNSGQTMGSPSKAARRYPSPPCYLTFLSHEATKPSETPPDCFPVSCAGSEELKKAFGAASEGGRLSEINFARLADNLASIAFRFPFRIPPDYSLIIRSLTILEGIALSSDPNFNIVDEAYPYVARRLLFDHSPELQSALEEVMSASCLTSLLPSFSS